MSVAAWPSVLLGLCSWAVALWRCSELSLRAAVDAPRLAGALAQRVAHGDQRGALALCEALPSAWAAQCARAALLEADSPAELSRVLEDRRRMFRARAELGLGALQAFSRMAFPLALGSAIVALGGPLADGAGVSQVERALSAALQCATAGLLTSVFCRTSAVVLRKLAGRRLQEVAVVSTALVNRS